MTIDRIRTLFRKWLSEPALEDREVLHANADKQLAVLRARLQIIKNLQQIRGEKS